jgi:hypothetical protein
MKQVMDHRRIVDGAGGLIAAIVRTRAVHAHHPTARLEKGETPGGLAMRRKASRFRALRSGRSLVHGTTPASAGGSIEQRRERTPAFGRRGCTSIPGVVVTLRPFVCW